jgi:hypothetical protein
MTYPRLELEKKEDPADEFITLAVRMKLDLAGCRISLEDWKAMAKKAQWELHNFVTETSADIQEFKKMMTEALMKASRAKPEQLSQTSIAKVTKWKDTGPIPKEVSCALARTGLNLIEWKQTNRFTRYVLWSFATKRQGRNFAQSYVDLFACNQLDNSENEG